MTLDRLEELACQFFKVTPTDFIGGGKKCPDHVATARHVLRGTAVNKYNIPPKTICVAHSVDHSTIAASKQRIAKGIYDREMAEFSAYINAMASGVHRLKDEKGVERITNYAFDERFYYHPEKVNEKTGNHFFPAFHFVTKMGLPEPIGLTKWRQDKGHYADRVLDRSSLIGSFVHDTIDHLIKYDVDISHDLIAQSFPDGKEAQRVKECLHGFMNWIEEERPFILDSEQMYVGKDFGFTMDLRCKIKSNDYKDVYVVDWKTSKVVNEDHKMQVEAMRRVAKADKGLVVVLGNSTKKKYTATEIKQKDQDYYWARFQAAKSTAYVEMFKRNQIEPRKDDIPPVFQIHDKFTKV